MVKYSLCLISLLFACATLFALDYKNDWRHTSNGLSIYDNGYVDQPYLLILPNGDWFCVFTTAKGLEGSAGQHIVCCKSSDMGKSWSVPTDIEPSSEPSSSWGVPYLTESGRIYVFYDFNGDKVSTLDGKKIRDDMLGWYCYKFSDDFGKTWSERYRLPMRKTACDRGNDWCGDVQIFWGIDKPIRVGNSMVFAFSKLGKYMQELGEGWVYRCDNIETERDPDKLQWRLLPDGDFGIRENSLGSVQEEHNIVPLSNGDLFCIYRTTTGYAAQSYSRDGGKSWSVPILAEYEPNGAKIKTPRACPKLYRATNGKYLLWFHNHSERGLINRNPAWVLGGVEKNGVILWGQPEILLHDPEDISESRGRYSYPDFIDRDGRYWVSETQKIKARIHEIPSDFLDGLWGQFDNKKEVADAVIFEKRDVKKGGETFKHINLPHLDKGGFTMEFWVKFDTVKPREAIYQGMNPFGGGVEVRVGGNGSVRATLSNYFTNHTLATDIGTISAGGLHHIVFVADGYARILYAVVDGKFCDGGDYSNYGWARLEKSVKDVNCGAQTSTFGASDTLKVERVRFYNRPLKVYEIVGNYKANK